MLHAPRASHLLALDAEDSTNSTAVLGAVRRGWRHCENQKDTTMDLDLATGGGALFTWLALTSMIHGAIIGMWRWRRSRSGSKARHGANPT